MIIIYMHLVLSQIQNDYQSFLNNDMICLIELLEIYSIKLSKYCFFASKTKIKTMQLLTYLR